MDKEKVVSAELVFTDDETAEQSIDRMLDFLMPRLIAAVEGEPEKGTAETGVL